MRSLFPEHKTDDRFFDLPFMFVALVGAITVGLAVCLAPMAFQDLFNQGRAMSSLSDSAEIAISAFGAACERFREEAYRYPDSLDELTQDNERFRVPESDPWGKKYLYIVDHGTSKFYLISAGPDREFGTGDDISNLD